MRSKSIQPNSTSPTAQGGASSQSAGIRVDIWLWAVRAFKTRSLAKAAIDAGCVSVNGVLAKASKLVGAGDEVKFQREHVQYAYQILGVASQRGSATMAATLYAETANSIAERERQRAAMKLDRERFTPSLNKPNKQDRRALSALRDKDFQ